MSLVQNEQHEIVRFVSLPTEVLLLVASELDFASLIAVAWTCKKMFHSFAPTKPGRTYRMQDLLKIEKWDAFSVSDSKAQPCAKDFFACCYCLRLRSALKFSNAMMRSPRGKHTQKATTAPSSRFCIDCGIYFHRYLPGDSMNFGGTLSDPRAGYGFVCKSCRHFERDDLDEENQRLCLRCSALQLFGEELDDAGYYTGMSDSD